MTLAEFAEVAVVPTALRMLGLDDTLSNRILLDRLVDHLIEEDRS